MKKTAFIATVVALQLSTGAFAQLRTGRTAEASSLPSTTQQGRSQLDETARAVQQMWGLTADEMQRAKVLSLGPRANFSVKELSPLEVLGIHARNDAERRQYAERMARIFHQDVERSILWDREMQAAMARLYPNEPMVNYDRLPRVQSSVGAADMLNVPRTQIIERASPAPANRGKR
ncbi:integrating conjugative element protein [Comamonas testosteroni]|uniref:Integrating conjugative element protein n=1 Tax=Comamonas testosteroni TaxID=285 RepID=A0A096GQ25_COMTE|nr:integrating conjugative element protein [Comamonas testosteroni]KGH27295.1 hypothetical protein P353_18615 [Comamonas testosteroni]